MIVGCPGLSRVAKRGPVGEVSDLARLLLEGRRAKDYTPLLGYLRGLTPSKLDGELREMQVQHSIILACHHVVIHQCCKTCTERYSPAGLRKSASAE